MSEIDEVLRNYPEIEELPFTFKRSRKGILQYQASTKFKIYEVTLLPSPLIDLHKEEFVEKLFEADDSAVMSWSFVAGGC